MDLSPEERKKIYEEEKARMEGRSQAEKESIPLESSTTLAPRIAGFLCYLGFWVSGLVFFIIEQKNRWVRFHAAQSLLTFGTLFIANLVLGNIPYIKWFFGPVITILAIILWIVLMVKAYNGEKFKLPLFGEIAEMMVGGPGVPGQNPPVPPAQPAAPEVPQLINAPPPPIPPLPPAAEPPQSSQSGYTTSRAPAPAAFVETDKRTQRKIDAWFSHHREGRITGSAFAIAWNIILIIFFNFFNQYVAYYTGGTVNGVIHWTREPFFTSDISRWLPILNTALVVAIICNIVMIVVDSKLLNQALHVIMNAFALAAIITLLVVNPLDFNVIPNASVATGVTLGVNIALIIIAVGIGIGLLVQLIKLLVSSLKVVFKVVE